MESSRPIEHGSDILQLLKERFESAEDSILATIEARSRDRVQFIENSLLRRKDKEKDNITKVLSDLTKTIQSEMDLENLPKQLEIPGMGQDERNQIRKDIEALHRRLVQ